MPGRAGPRDADGRRLPGESRKSYDTRHNANPRRRWAAGGSPGEGRQHISLIPHMGFAGR